MSLRTASAGSGTICSEIVPCSGHFRDYVCMLLSAAHCPPWAGGLKLAASSPETQGQFIDSVGVDKLKHVYWRSFGALSFRSW